MKEEPGPAFVRDDGLPINWPLRDGSQAVRND